MLLHFSQCDAAFLEANYDVEMLANGGYPYHLKKRISGGNGHISNIQALELFNMHRPPFMGRLILSHLSKNNNSPALVQQLFEQHARGVKITVASRYEETPLFYINHTHVAAAEQTAVEFSAANRGRKSRPYAGKYLQLALFS